MLPYAIAFYTSESWFGKVFPGLSFLRLTVACRWIRIGSWRLPVDTSLEVLICSCVASLRLHNDSLQQVIAEGTYYLHWPSFDIRLGCSSWYSEIKEYALTLGLAPFLQNPLVLSPHLSPILCWEGDNGLPLPERDPWHGTCKSCLGLYSTDLCWCRREGRWRQK